MLTSSVTTTHTVSRKPLVKSDWGFIILVAWVLRYKLPDSYSAHLTIWLFRSILALLAISQTTLILTSGFLMVVELVYACHTVIHGRPSLSGIRWGQLSDTPRPSPGPIGKGVVWGRDLSSNWLLTA